MKMNKKLRYKMGNNTCNKTYNNLMEQFNINSF